METNYDDTQIKTKDKRQNKTIYAVVKKSINVITRASNYAARKNMHTYIHNEYN
jgi:hypothetical protein